MSWKKILLIVYREYITRVRKKSFIIMTLVGPLIFASIMVIPILVSYYTVNDKKIAVIDENKIISFQDKLPESEHLHFVYLHTDLKTAKKDFLNGPYDGILFIPEFQLDAPRGISFYSKGNVGLETKQMLEYNINKEIEEMRLMKSGIDPDFLDNIKADINISIVNLTLEGEQKKNTAAATTAGLFGAIMIYFFIFLYGTQVMRGVIEEKTSRIIEVMITSVKPFELMMGKILGIAAVALTQFILWVVLTFATSAIVSLRFQVDRFSDQNITQTMMKMKGQGDINQAMEVNKIVSAIESLNLPLLLVTFIFYFMMGYLLYSALFAAIGSMVDNETDTQQFMIPVTVPLILAFIFAQTIIRNPDSNLGIWLSMIPLTSPLIMMVRLPFGVPPVELILSMLIIIITFFAATWLAARIYRVGILMYGKKPTYKEVSKWLFYR